MHRWSIGNINSCEHPTGCQKVVCLTMIARGWLDFLKGGPYLVVKFFFGWSFISLNRVSCAFFLSSGYIFVSLSSSGENL